MTLWQFMDCAYAVLGFGKDAFQGLFGDFDPALYHGMLPLERHFVNLFMKRLRTRLRRALHPRSDDGRKGKREKFRESRGLGLICGADAQSG
jgi:hypothetical protein